MNARRVLVLLGAGVLSMFLMSPTALSRPGEFERFDPSETVDGIVADDGPIDGPEDDPAGDDDNWDKPAPGGKPTLEELGADGQRRWLGPELPEEKTPRLGRHLRFQLRFLLRTWGIFVGIR